MHLIILLGWPEFAIAPWNTIPPWTSSSPFYALKVWERQKIQIKIRCFVVPLNGYVLLKVLNYLLVFPKVQCCFKHSSYLYILQVFFCVTLVELCGQRKGHYVDVIIMSTQPDHQSMCLQFHWCQPSSYWCCCSVLAQQLNLRTSQLPQSTKNPMALEKATK